MKSFYALLKELNIDEKHIAKPKTDLPLLFHYGRADMTVSFFVQILARMMYRKLYTISPNLSAKLIRTQYLPKKI